MRNSFILWFAALLHFSWSVLLVADPSTLQVTSLSFLAHIFPHRYLLAGFLLGSSVLAFASFRQQLSGKVLATLLLPQQFALMFSTLSALRAVYLGEFGPGGERPPAFIAAAMLPIILLGVMHTAAVMRAHNQQQLRRA